MYGYYWIACLVVVYIHIEFCDRKNIQASFYGCGTPTTLWIDTIFYFVSYLIGAPLILFWHCVTITDKICNPKKNSNK